MMHAVYSLADNGRLIGFVDADHRDRLPFKDDAGAFASREPIADNVRRSTLAFLRSMEGIPSWRP